MPCFCGILAHHFQNEVAEQMEQPKVAVTDYRGRLYVQEDIGNENDLDVAFLSNCFLDVFNTLFDSIDDLSDHEGFPTPSNTSGRTVRLATDSWSADVIDDIVSPSRKKTKADLPKRYEISKQILMMLL